MLAWSARDRGFVYIFVETLYNTKDPIAGSSDLLVWSEKTLSPRGGGGGDVGFDSSLMSVDLFFLSIRTDCRKNKHPDLVYKIEWK